LRNFWQHYFASSQNSISAPILYSKFYFHPDTEYHDAFTQCGPPVELLKSEENYCCRDTQTVHVVDSTEVHNVINSKDFYFIIFFNKYSLVPPKNTHSDKALQQFGAATEEIYIATVNDVPVEAGEYETYREAEERRHLMKHVLILQRNFRRFILLKCVKKCAADYRALLAEQKARQAKQQENFVNKYLRECILKAQPTTKQDFDVLHAQIQKWKLSEVRGSMRQYT
jgi:hypothetical protein